MMFRPETEAAIRAHFALGRAFYEVMDDPTAPGAEQLLDAAVSAARRASIAAGLQDVDPQRWMNLVAIHPAFPAELEWRRELTEKWNRRAEHLAAMQDLVDAGERADFSTGVAAILEGPLGTRVLRWMAGAA